MHLYRNLFDKIIDGSNILEAYKKASNLKHQKPEFIRYESNLAYNLQVLQIELLYNTYNVGRYTTFKVNEPKERLIMKLPAKDRVAQHAWNNICNPIFETKFIYDSYACRPNKGVQRCVDKISKWIYNGYNINNTRVYAIKGDMHHYFQSINHNVLMNEICKVIGDDRVLDLTYKFISSNGKMGDGVGVPIGNLTSQLFANIYGNILDQYIKRELKCQLYARYMDDFTIIDNDYHRLQFILDCIRNFAYCEMKMTLNEKSTIVYIDENNALDFAGFRIYSNRVLPRKSTIERIYNLLYSLEDGIISIDDFCKSWPSMIGYIEFANSRNILNEAHNKLYNYLYELYADSDFYGTNFDLSSEILLENYYDTIFKYSKY